MYDIEQFRAEGAEIYSRIHTFASMGEESDDHRQAVLELREDIARLLGNPDNWIAFVREPPDYGDWHCAPPSDKGD